MPGKIDEEIGSAERLEALERTELMDSPPEEALDRLTRLAAAVLHVPVALVSLVDGERQFFKSAAGLPEPWASLRQTPLTHSFCKHAVASAEPFLVCDARDNPLVKDNAAVSELGVIAYAGIPLTTADGHTLGTLCVVDGRPRAWKDEEVEILRSLAASVMTEIEARRLAVELSGISKDLQRLVDVRTGQLSHAEERWRVLLQVNNAVVTCLDRETLFEAVTGALRDVVPFDRAALVLEDPADGVFKLLGVAGPVSTSAVLPHGKQWPRQGTRCGWVADHGIPLLTADLRESPRYLEHDPLIQNGILSALSVPLRAKGKVIGTLNVGSREVGRYGEKDSELLLAIADQVVLAIRNTLAYEEIASLKSRLEEENLYLQEECRAEQAFADVVGESAVIQKVLSSVRMVAGTESNVLVTGETGTGKELVVRAIHGLSARKDKILVKVNCAALPAGVIESELFGHERGAFTGALSRRVGRFELANGGTLFLDEVGDLPLELQAKLLRVLQDGEFERVGGTQTLRVNVRLVAATNRNLHRAVEEGRFRADLFYRLNAITLPVPALRERREDIAALARHFLQLANAANGTNIASIDEDALDALQNHQWPGNVRELRNVIERGVVIAEHATLTLHDLPQALRNHMPRALPLPASLAHERNRCQPGEDFRACMERIEAEVLIAALDDAQWNKSETARRLQMPRRTLVHKIRVHRIKPSEPKE